MKMRGGNKPRSLMSQVLKTKKERRSEKGKLEERCFLTDQSKDVLTEL